MLTEFHNVCTVGKRILLNSQQNVFPSPISDKSSIKSLVKLQASGDLLLTGVAWPTVGSLPRPVCAGCGRWPGGRAAPVSDETAH